MNAGRSARRGGSPFSGRREKWSVDPEECASFFSLVPITPAATVTAPPIPHSLTQARLCNRVNDKTAARSALYSRRSQPGWRACTRVCPPARRYIYLLCRGFDRGFENCVDTFFLPSLRRKESSWIRVISVLKRWFSRREILSLKFNAIAISIRRIVTNNKYYVRYIFFLNNKILLNYKMTIDSNFYS